MNKQSFNTKKVIEEIYSSSFDPLAYGKERFAQSIISNPLSGFRPNSMFFEGGGFGDEGKGLTVAREVDKFLKKYKKVIVYRWNGGSNAGHECMLPDGKMIALHQFSTGILHEGTTAIMGRTMVLHPGDVIVEMNEIKSRLGKVPGKLVIDPNITLALDTHRVMERVTNNWHLGYSGSTARGISTSYADDTLRLKLTMKDLMSSDWQVKFGYHYDRVEKLVGAYGFDLKSLRFATLDSGSKGVLMGSKRAFLKRLESQRTTLAPFVDYEVLDFIEREWKGDTPFVFEGAQAIGLHLKHGVYPDVTASETRARGIQDATEGIIDYRLIAGKFGVIKGPYMSSVGSRIMPGTFDFTSQLKTRDEFAEYGKSTGRARGIIPPDIPALSYWRSVADYDYLVVTHMDAGYSTIPVVTEYVNSEGKYVRYRPYQWFIDTVIPEIIELPGWDGKKANKAKVPEDLPENALRFLRFLELTMNTKVAWATTGPNYEDSVYWLPTS